MYKLKSNLPKVLLQDNIGLEQDLTKTVEHLSHEEKRTVSFWKGTKRKFLRLHKLKRFKTSDVVKLPAIGPRHVNAQVSKKYLPLPSHQELPKIPEIKPRHRNTHHTLSNSIRDQRFVRLQDMLTKVPE